jgi:hypothetical protein
VLSSSICWAQNKYILYSDRSASLIINQNDTTKNSFAGGINAAQIGKVNLNSDTIPDLVIFDKSTGVLSTFLAENSEYIYHPEYSIFFPNINNWVLFKDYNKDGLTDIFTHASGGINVYQNISGKSGIPIWKLVKSPLLSKGFSGMINIQINPTDLPSIEDIDGDGDLDLICYNFFNGSQIEYHLNQSVDLYGHKDSLNFKRVDDCWGGAEEISCGKYNFGLQCATELRKSNKRLQHVAASTLLAIDLDGDNDMDLLGSKEECNNIALLQNYGNRLAANFNKVDTTYPDNIKRSRFPYGASFFYEDMDFDQVKDLIISTNLPVNNSNTKDYAQTTWLYKNIGQNINPTFTFKQKNFIQESMIDVGENASPAFADIDADNDYDLIIGNRGKFDSLSNAFYSTLHLYENVGSSKKAIFKLVTTDYLGLSSYKKTSIKPYFTDLNNDNILDFVYLSTQNGVSKISYVINTNSKDKPFKLDTSNINTINSITTAYTDNLTFEDINNDGWMDVLIGKYNGTLSYWMRNTTQIDFSLITTSFGNLTTQNNRLQTEPYIIDFNANGTRDLLLADNSGRLYLYEDIQKIASNNMLPKADTLLINPSIYSSFPTVRLGFTPTIISADLNNDNQPEFYFGNAAGGIVALSKTKGNEIIPEQSKNYVNIYPNPSFNNTFTVECNTDGIAHLYDVSGKKIIENIRLSALIKNEIYLPQLSAGLYFLQTTNTNSTTIHKVILQ